MTTSTCADSLNFHLMMNGNTCAEYYAVQCPASCGTCTPEESAFTPTTTDAPCADDEGTILDENGKQHLFGVIFFYSITFLFFILNYLCFITQAL